MREILFRGYRKERQKWAYGLLTKDFGKFMIDGFVVEDESIGQFTGLKDVNGNKIYEGDILSVSNGSINTAIWKDKPYSVEYILNKGFDMCMFCWDKEGNDIMDSTHYCEVVGNKFLNPELC